MFFAARGFRIRKNKKVRRIKRMNKRLYRSKDNRMLCGVCAGIAEYFDIDPTLVRLGWALLCAMGGSGVIAYIVAAVIIPECAEY